MVSQAGSPNHSSPHDTSVGKKRACAGLRCNIHEGGKIARMVDIEANSPKMHDFRFQTQGAGGGEVR